MPERMRIAGDPIEPAQRICIPPPPCIRRQAERLSSGAIEVARLGLDRDGGGAEHFDETPARSPECRRFCAGRRRQVFSYGPEHLSDNAVRCPVC
jgi:hypothetical protein